MKKHSKKIVSLMLALLMVFSLLPMSSISALAAGSNSPVAVQADDTVTAAPAPVFYSVLTDLSRQSATYYADDSDKVGQLRVQLKYNPTRIHWRFYGRCPMTEVHLPMLKAQELQ